MLKEILEESVNGLSWTLQWGQGTIMDLFIPPSARLCNPNLHEGGGVSELVTLYLILGVTASVHGCLSLYVGPVMSLRLVLGAPRQLG